MFLAGKSLWISGKTFFFLEITCFWPEQPLKISISSRKSLWISAKTFFLETTLVLLEIASIQFENNENLGQVRSRINLQKSPLLCEILATRLFFTKVLSTLKKHPPMQNFTYFRMYRKRPKRRRISIVQSSLVHFVSIQSAVVYTNCHCKYVESHKSVGRSSSPSHKT